MNLTQTTRGTQFYNAIVELLLAEVYPYNQFTSVDPYMSELRASRTRLRVLSKLLIVSNSLSEKDIRT